MLREDSKDDVALPNGSAAQMLWLGGSDPESARNVVYIGTLPGGAAYLCRPTALQATGKVCRIEDIDLTSPESRAAARLRGGRLRFPLSVSDHVLRTEQVARAASAFRTASPSLALCAGDPAVLEDPMTCAGADQSVTPRFPHGPLQSAPDQTDPAMVKLGTTLGERPRDWDCAIWPNANAEFSKSDQDILRRLEKAQTA